MFAGKDVKQVSTKSGSLYPFFRSCPHPGCFNFMFRSRAESLQHEKTMHPGQRSQRLRDWSHERKGKPPPQRIHACHLCSATFSSPAFLVRHRASYLHQTDAKIGRDKAARERAGGLEKRPKKKIRKMERLVREAAPVLPTVQSRRRQASTEGSNPRPARRQRRGSRKATTQVRESEGF